MISKLVRLSQSKLYWLAYVLGGIALLSVALFYQYYLEELPCVLCIQIRLWISVFIVVGLLGLLFYKHRFINLVAQLACVFAAVGFVERAYQLLGTERGFVFGDCGFSAGLPAWFAIESWLPWIYQVETSCGYTPELLFTVTMAEALMLMSILVLLMSSSVFMASIMVMRKN